jgi:hypothetical protein
MTGGLNSAIFYGAIYVPIEHTCSILWNSKISGDSAKKELKVYREGVHDWIAVVEDKKCKIVCRSVERWLWSNKTICTSGVLYMWTIMTLLHKMLLSSWIKCSRYCTISINPAVMRMHHGHLVVVAGDRAECRIDLSCNMTKMPQNWPRLACFCQILLYFMAFSLSWPSVIVILVLSTAK